MTWLGLGLGVVALLLWWLQGRRLGPRGARRQTVSLGGQHALHVVELEGRRLVVGTGPAGAPRLVAELRPREARGQADEELDGGARAGASGSSLGSRPGRPMDA